MIQFLKKFIKQHKNYLGGGEGGKGRERKYHFYCIKRLQTPCIVKEF